MSKSFINAAFISFFNIYFLFCDYVISYLYFVCLDQWPYEAAALAFEAIPRTLAQNCGLNVIRIMTQLQGKVIIKLFLLALVEMLEAGALSLRGGTPAFMDPV